jgi:uncharacterized protein YecE (DUF72 family)
VGTIPAGTIRVGMSGFSYPEWIGEIYPEGTKRKDMLATYATIFPAVEINMSYRRNPLPKTIDTWRDAAPDGFTFAMKANQRITMWKRLVDTTDDIAEGMTIYRGLQDHLGPVLFQLHPTTRYDPDVFDAFCAGLVAGGRYALEPRHESWLTPDAHEQMRRHDVALCLNDDHFDIERYRVTGPFAYFRFHRELYGSPDLNERAELVRRLASDVDVYAFFAHEDNPDSVRPALRFQELVR